MLNPNRLRKIVEVNFKLLLTAFSWKARLGNPYQPVVLLGFFRNCNLNYRFDARPRW